MPLIVLKSTGSAQAPKPAACGYRTLLAINANIAPEALISTLGAEPRSLTDALMSEFISEDQRDCLQELANVAMGQSADRLARLLDVFVVLTIPNVSILTPVDIAMTLQSLQDSADNSQPLSGVCQGFIGGGLAGEAMLIFNGTDYQSLAELLKYQDHHTAEARNELLMDTANVLTGACLHGLAEQLDIQFSFGPPTLLGENFDIPALLNQRHVSWDRALVIEIGYTIEDRRVNCDLLIVISEQSIQGLLEKLDYLLD